MRIRLTEDGLTFLGKVWMTGEECENPPRAIASLTEDDQITKFGRRMFRVIDDSPLVEEGVSEIESSEDETGAPEVEASSSDETEVAEVEVEEETETETEVEPDTTSEEETEEEEEETPPRRRRRSRTSE